MRLMVVDDSPIDRLLLRRGLAEAFPDASLRVVGASRREFLATLDETECDVVVADYSLGWADGFEIMRRVRERWPECRAILFTVMPSDQLFSRAMKAGFDACLTKSTDLEALTLAVEGALARSGKFY
jgi:two-component system capsular synthesis sensor histidine kinase RcsC